MDVNSIRSKFEALEFLTKDKFDVFLVSASKLNSSFPEVQFEIPGYRMFWQDRDKYGDGLICYLTRTSHVGKQRNTHDRDKSLKRKTFNFCIHSKT